MSWHDDPRSWGNRAPMTAQDLADQRAADDLEAEVLAMLAETIPDAADWTTERIETARALVLARHGQPAALVEVAEERPRARSRYVPPGYQPAEPRQSQPVALVEPEPGATGWEPEPSYAEELETYMRDVGLWRSDLSELELTARAMYATSPTAVACRHQRMWMGAVSARTDASWSGNPRALGECMAISHIIAKADHQAGALSRAAMKDKALETMGRHAVFVNRRQSRYDAALVAEERAKASGIRATMRAIALEA